MELIIVLHHRYPGPGEIPDTEGRAPPASGLCPAGSSASGAFHQDGGPSFSQAVSHLSILLVLKVTI
jgi:hypothetical protein